MTTSSGSIAKPIHTVPQPITGDVASQIARMLADQQHRSVVPLREALASGDLERVRQTSVSITDSLEKLFRQNIRSGNTSNGSQPRFIDRSFITANDNQAYRSDSLALLAQADEFFHATFAKTLEQYVAHLNTSNRDALSPFDDAAASVFLKRLAAARAWLLSPDVATRFDLMLQQVSNVQTRERMVALMSAHGHLIHGVSANDNTSRRAYYHLLVQPEREAEFLEVLDENRIINLEDYGKVLFSVYDDVFQKQRLEKADQELKEQVSRFTSLTTRQRTYAVLNGSFDQSPSLMEARARADRERLDDKMSWPQRLKPEAAQQFVEMALDRRLTLDDIGALAAWLTKDEADDTQPTIERLRRFTQMLGDGETGAKRLVALVASGWHPSNKEQLLAPALAFGAMSVKPYSHSGVIDERSWRDAASAKALLSGLAFAAFSPAMLALLPVTLNALKRQNDWQADQYENWVEQHWRKVRLDITRLTLSFPSQPELLKRLQAALASKQPEKLRRFETTLGDAQRLFRQAHTFHFEKVQSDNFDSLGVLLSSNIKKVLIKYHYDGKIDWYEAFIKKYSYAQICSIATFGEYIQSQDTEKRIEMLTQLLEPSVELAFKEADTPVNQRAELLDEFVRRLLGLPVKRMQEVEAGSGTWAARVSGAGSLVELPKTAPALWRHDKRKGDTPPDFIKRHYADHLLGANDTHQVLSRPELKRLDESLYMALANWLRANELPDDCPVPTKSEMVDREAEAVKSMPIDELRKFRAEVRTMENRRVRSLEK